MITSNSNYLTELSEQHRQDELAEATAMRMLREAVGEMNIVNPMEPYYDDGEVWQALGNGSTFGINGAVERSVGFITEQQLSLARRVARDLAVENEFAICGHQNRISYIIGTGHTYTVVSKAETNASEEAVKAVQAVVDNFTKINRWHARQQEIQMRFDRDGECFVRTFPSDDGILRVRFVEPALVSQNNGNADPNASFGVVTEPDDVETVLAYIVNGQPIDASEIQHRKANVDLNVKRGVPLFFPVRKNLLRAEKLLRNMSVTSEIQTAIAMIRKHKSASSSAISSFRTNQATITRNNSITGQTDYKTPYKAGAIVDGSANTEYEFPTAGLDASKYVLVLQAELRAISSRLQMPEFMLSSDASNANYASTMVAEGPAVQSFKRAQAAVEEADRELLAKVLAFAVASGKVTQEAVDATEIQVGKPLVASRDGLKEAQIAQILQQLGAISPQTICVDNDLDYAQEMANLERHRQQFTEPQQQTQNKPGVVDLAAVKAQMDVAKSVDEARLIFGQLLREG